VNQPLERVGLDPVLPLAVELTAELQPHFQAGSALNLAVCEALETASAEVMATLGIPGRVRVTVRARLEPGGTPLRLFVDEQPLRHPDEVLLVTYAHVNTKPLEAELKVAALGPWLKQLCDSVTSPGHETVVQFLSRACLEVVKLQPAVLLGPAQLEAYAESVAGARAKARAPEPQLLRNLLATLLEMRISVANVPAVAAILTADPAPAVEVGLEDLIDSLRGEAVEIHLSRALLQELTTRHGAEASSAFPSLRDGLFLELGVEIPPFRFAVDERLAPNSFAFRVNHVTSAPYLGLATNQRLTNDTADRARVQGLDVIPVTDPVTGQPVCLIDVADEARAQSLGLTTWNPLQHLVRCLGECLRRHGWCTVHRRGVRRQLETAVFIPSLISTFRSVHTDEELTSVLRALVRDGVSVQNLRLVLEQWLDYDLLRDGGPADSRRDPTLTDPVAFVRVGLGREIAGKAAKRTETVVVYLLDAEAERLASVSPAGQLGKVGDDLLRALRAEMAYLPPTAFVPNILTFVEARSTLQRLINTEFPRMSVIAHEELPPGINVQPIARISLRS
jgi:type III secretion protein V